MGVEMKRDKRDNNEQFPIETMPFGFIGNERRGNGTTVYGATERVKQYLENHGSINRDQLDDIADVANPLEVISGLKRRYGLNIICHRRRRPEISTWEIVE